MPHFDVGRKYMKEESKNSTVGKILIDYLHELDCITDCISPAVSAIYDKVEENESAYKKFLEEKTETTEDDEDSKTYRFKIEYQREHDDLKKSIKRSRDALVLIPKSLVISMVASYDAFLGRLVRALYESKPVLLNGGDRQISFSQIKKFESIKDAEDFILEKEIDTLLRKSHSDQFKSLEKDFSVKLKANDPIWTRFIELTERRNLLVHSDGVISSQYLKVCGEHGVSLSKKFEVGHKLSIDPKYFFVAHRVLYEIGFQLTHTLWRKILPDQIDIADDYINESGFELLCEKNYSLSTMVYEFALKQQQKHSSEQYRLMFLVNLCISYINSDQNEEATKLLDSEDWSAKSDDFQLANKVLREEYEAALTIMAELPENRLGKSEYRTWPLFSKFRKEQQFQDFYKSKFGEDFEIEGDDDDNSELRDPE
jgi:hypothetical protein